MSPISLKLFSEIKFFLRSSEALDDSNEAVRIDQTNVKAFLRKGISLYHLDKKEEAAKTFKQGICIDGKFWTFLCEFFSEKHWVSIADNDQMKVWLEKCEKELPATSKYTIHCQL